MKQLSGKAFFVRLANKELIKQLIIVINNSTHSKTFKAKQHTLERWKNGEKRMFEKQIVGSEKIV